MQIDLRESPETKTSLASRGQQAIYTQQGSNEAFQLGAAKYLECSALTQEGLKQVFDDAIRVVLASQSKPANVGCCIIL